MLLLKADLLLFQREWEKKAFSSDREDKEEINHKADSFTPTLFFYFQNFRTAELQQAGPPACLTLESLGSHNAWHERHLTKLDK